MNEQAARDYVRTQVWKAVTKAEGKVDEAFLDYTVANILSALRPAEQAKKLSLAGFEAEDLTSIAEVVRESAEFGTEFDGVLERFADRLDELA